jgi:hypothetical protein
MYTDPLAQSFTISSSLVQAAETIALTGLDLFFAQADPTLGINIELRSMNNGLPTRQIIPFTVTHLTANQVSVSTDASVPTHVDFTSPVFLKTDNEYCIVIRADGNSPNYLLWASQTGANDITNPAVQIRSDWGQGAMFTSTNDQTWQVIQDQNVKFTIYRANFNATSGNVVISNSDDEFFTGSVANTTFMQGEMAFRYAGTITGNVSYSNTTSVISGNGTSFLTQYAAGARIVLTANVALGTAGPFEIFKVASVSNNVSLTIYGIPKRTATGVVALNTVTGRVTYADAKGRLSLTNSTANSTAFFANGDIVIGATTGAVYTSTAVVNQTVNYFQPLISKTTPVGTTLSGSVTMVDNTFTTQSSLPIVFGDTTFVTNFEGIVASKSNEIAAFAGAKSFNTSFTLTPKSVYISPSIDLQSASILRYKNNINNSLAGEATPNGTALAKSISSTITLADGQDAEDLLIYVDYWKPQGTFVDFYMRLLSSTDSEVLPDKTWTHLAALGPEAYSDSSNINDIIERQYSFANTPATTAVGGVVATTISSTTVTGSNTTFTGSIPVGSTVLITNPVQQYFVSQVSAVANNTQLTLVDSAPWTSTSSSIATFVNNQEGYRDTLNLNYLSYFSDVGKYTTFKTYVIKIVLRSPNTHAAPRLKNIRVIATTV